MAGINPQFGIETNKSIRTTSVCFKGNFQLHLQLIKEGESKIGDSFGEGSALEFFWKRNTEQWNHCICFFSCAKQFVRSFSSLSVSLSLSLERQS